MKSRKQAPIVSQTIKYKNKYYIRDLKVASLPSKRR